MTTQGVFNNKLFIRWTVFSDVSVLNFGFDVSDTYQFLDSEIYNSFVKHSMQLHAFYKKNKK